MKALLIIDVQNDFCPGGALGVPEGDKIVKGINEIMSEYDYVVASQDWHPANHGSFAANHNKAPGEVIILNELQQILWPVHCVQGTHGAELHPDLEASTIDEIFTKGENPGIDSYSAFFDNGRKQATGLDKWLKKQGVDEVHICGLATDYCVKYTALDAVSLGYRTFMLPKLSRGVELNKGDIKTAMREMEEAGVKLVDYGEYCIQ